MDLKSMLNEQIQSEEQESNSADLMKLIEEQKSVISKLQSEKLEMQSMLKKQDEKLKEQNKYVEQSKLNESNSRKLLKEAQEAKALSDKASKERAYALQQAEADRKRAEQAREQERQAHNKRLEAERKATTTRASAESSKSTYKSLLIGQMIFTLAIALLIAISKREVLRSMVSWFPSRAKNIKAFVSWIAMIYMAAIHLIQGKWEIGNWAYLIVTILSLGFFVVFSFVARLLFIKINNFISELRLNCLDTTLKDIITGDIALISLYICLFFADPIQKGVLVNIFSLWLTMSMIGIVVWYMPQIIEIMKEKFKL